MLAPIGLPLKYEAEEHSTGMTGYAGLPVFLELMATSVECRLRRPMTSRRMRRGGR